ncbi:MAG TPA: putative N-acetylmannosamine-6-phosphate 2-epimerase [Corynebacterium pollutisoli]|nr:putative N-acetylmannosamine-6-phosphate 2-epimerase [Corynebacterium pollutisoli]
MNDLTTRLRGRLIVSVQAPDGHAMRDTRTLAHVAQACVDGGAAAIRCGGYGGLDDIRAIVDKLGDAAPVFGLTKEGTEGVYITPSVASVEAVAAAGAGVVCVDATFRPRQDGSTLEDQVAAAHAEGVLIMADCATPDEARAALEAGCDLMSTTLAGYTPDRAKTDGPDLDCVRDSRNLLGPDTFLIGEGRYRTPAEAAHGLLAGADAVIVGTAITDPGWITAQFAAHLH